MDDWAGFGSEEEFENYIRELLLLANSPEALGLTEEPVPTSPKFQKWEKKLLADPFGYARKALRPTWRKVLNVAACVVLAVTVAFGGLMAVNPEARAWVSRIVTEWYEDHVRFSFREDKNGDLGVWEPSYLPTGFKEISRNNDGELKDAVYQNEEGDSIVLNYQLAKEDSCWFGIDTEHVDYEEVTVGNHEAYLLRATASGRPNYLLWKDNDSGVVFLLMADTTLDETFLIAEGMVILK